MIVADSDVLIDALRGKGPAADHVRRMLTAGRLATTAVSAFELHSGARSDRQRQSVDRLLGALPILPLDPEAAQAAAEVRRELEAQGQGIGMADYLIAGICVARGAAILTGNRRHFERVAGLEIV